MVGNFKSGRSKAPIKIVQLTQDGFDTRWNFTQTEWSILCYLGQNNNSVLAISEACFYNIAETTIRRTINKFIKHGLVDLKWRKQGKTKRQNIFKITENGLEAWNCYLSTV